MNRRSFLTLMLSATLGAAATPARAQRGDMIHFAEFDGLERVIARSWLAPMALPEDEASPVPASPEATDLATPETGPGGIRSLSVFIYLFRTDQNAADGYQRIDDDLTDTRENDANAPMEDELALDGIGDLANGYSGVMTQGGDTLTFTFATVQDGPFVYSLSGIFEGQGDNGLTGQFAEALVSSRMDRMAEQYDPEGGSRGGLWSKLNAVQPTMPDGSSVTDFEIYPMPESTSRRTIRR
ncbi:MAG TPA: hypothetical protein VKZ61_07070 [Thermomicrobiales bacterium]|jgi:hypothetical protein|nr:hypothetical protein [Thermomicrobiales bacterium]